ncbi:hypothetical protein IMCC3317_11020 [Kordia antarctica]|uniref:TonB-dependent receptor SusC n=1 Tax=Kordia antarctica TaxID=1218801 RepID=A0A7L4ZIK4_9FLAO|nr:carboxypeptidase-like regulatory domain-containing protein [Kordia antarctica]QHI35754.1 hypothetical protein IMCC3317_11020 [Kordia antarctica]
MSQFNFNSTCAKDTRTITITGQVFDTITHETLPFANVYLTIDNSIGTAANEDGIFSIDIPEGSTLTVSFTGYLPFKFRVTQEFTKVFLTRDDQLDTVYLEGPKKKKSNGWLWLLFFGGLVAVATNQEEEQKGTSKTRKPIKAKI